MTKQVALTVKDIGWLAFNVAKSEHTPRDVHVTVHSKYGKGGFVIIEPKSSNWLIDANLNKYGGWSLARGGGTDLNELRFLSWLWSKRRLRSMVHDGHRRWLADRALIAGMLKRTSDRLAKTFMIEAERYPRPSVTTNFAALESALVLDMLKHG